MRSPLSLLLLLLPLFPAASAARKADRGLKDPATEDGNALGRVRVLEMEIRSAIGGPGGESTADGASLAGVGPRKQLTLPQSKRGPVFRARKGFFSEDVDLAACRRVILNNLDHHYQADNRLRFSCTAGLEGLEAFDALPRCPVFQACPGFLTSMSPHQIGADLELGTPLVPHGAMEACSAGFHDDDWDYRPQPPLNCPWYTMGAEEKRIVLEPFLNRNWIDEARSTTLAMLANPELGCAHRIDFAPETPVAYGVFRLRGVYVSGESVIFNRSHIFVQQGCQDGSFKNSPSRYEAGQKAVRHVGAVVHWGYRLANNFFHSLIESFPLLLSLAPIMNQHRHLRMLLRKDQLQVYEAVLEPLVGVPLVNMRRYEMRKTDIYHADLLYQPNYQYCGRSSHSLWHELRRRHLLHPDGIPLFNPDWSLRQVEPLTEAQMAHVPEDWVVVLAERPQGSERSIVQAQDLALGLIGMLPPGRVVVFKGAESILQARNLFRRTRLYIAAHGAGMANMVFMPTNSSVLEIRPDNYMVNCYHSQADSCSLRYYLVMGKGTKHSLLDIDVPQVLATVRKIVATF